MSFRIGNVRHSAAAVSGTLILAATAAAAAQAPAMAQMARPGVPAAGATSQTSVPAAPTITSVGKNLYISGQATNFVGTPGVFRLSDSGPVTGYYYSLYGSQPDVYVPANSAGTATLPITPYSVNVLTLTVEAVDGAGPPSQLSSFVIETSLPPGNLAMLAWWPLNAGHGKTATDATGHNHGATLSGPVQNCAGGAAPDGYRCTMSVGGAGGQAATRPALLPTVGNNGNFTVSAWVNLRRCRYVCAAFSIDATQTFGFALQYKTTCAFAGKKGPCWRFVVPADDSSAAPLELAASVPGSAQLNRWTQLTGVFDPSQLTMSLYVNGVLRGSSTRAGQWAGAAPGPIRIGNSFPGGTAHDWAGRLSDICAFYGPVPSGVVSLLYHGDAAHPGNGCAALFSTYP